MKAYSTDLRQKIIDAYKNGEGSLRDIAKRFSVGLSFVWSLWAPGTTISLPLSGTGDPIRQLATDRWWLMKNSSSLCSASNSSRHYKTAYLAVFDTTTDQEIDTGKGTDNLKGIPLSVKNPLTIEYLAGNNLIYVQATGKNPFGSNPAEYTGSIETINPDNYETQLVLDDGDQNDHPFGQILNMALVTPTQAYFIGSTAFRTNSLYRFNPTNGEVFSDVDGPVAIAGLFDSNLKSLAVDKNKKLWVGNGDLAAPGMVVIDTADDTIEEALIGTDLNPIETCFCEI